MATHNLARWEYGERSAGTTFDWTNSNRPFSSASANHVPMLPGSVDTWVQCLLHCNLLHQTVSISQLAHIFSQKTPQASVRSLCFQILVFLSPFLNAMLQNALPECHCLSVTEKTNVHEQQEADWLTPAVLHASGSGRHSPLCFCSGEPLNPTQGN